jgi:hypothetical protein
MIESCKLVGANEHVITWKVPLQKEAKTNFSCVIGSVAYEDVEPRFCTVGLLADPLKMRFGISHCRERATPVARHGLPDRALGRV